MNNKVMAGVLVVLGLLLLGGAGVWFLTNNRGENAKVAGLNAPEVVLPTAEPTQVPAVILKIYSGSATVNGNAGTDGMKVFMGDKVVTGADSRVVLKYPNGTQTRLDFGAEIVLEKFVASPQQVEVKLEKGRIWSRVTKLFGGESYQTESGTVVATVRGTSYGHGILENGVNRLTGFKGKVQTDCINQTQSEEVVEDLRAEFDCKTGKKVVKTKLTTQQLLADEWISFNEGEDKKQEQEVGEDKFDDLNKVLGLTTENTQANPPAGEPLISCTGPDGKVFLATQADCDNLNKFWKDNTPTNPNPNGTWSEPGPSNNSNPAPTATPAAVLDRLEITPGSVEVATGGTPVSMEVKAYDNLGGEMSGVNFVWSTIPNDGSLGSVSGSGNLATFDPTGRGQGFVKVIVDKDGVSVFNKVPVSVGSGITSVQQISGCVPSARAAKVDFSLMSASECVRLKINGYGLSDPNLVVRLSDECDGTCYVGETARVSTISTEVVSDFDYLTQDACRLFDVGIYTYDPMTYTYTAVDVKPGALNLPCPPQFQSVNVSPAAFDGTAATCAAVTWNAQITAAAGLSGAQVNYQIYDQNSMQTDGNSIAMTNSGGDMYDASLALPVIPAGGSLVWNIHAVDTSGFEAYYYGTILDGAVLGCN
jgi:hypothetical protein